MCVRLVLGGEMCVRFVLGGEMCVRFVLGGEMCFKFVREWGPGWHLIAVVELRQELPPRARGVRLE